MFDAPEDQSYLVTLDSGILRLSFNRPAFGNAVPSHAVTLLTSLFQAARADPAVRCILIRGEGRVFSAGGDVASFARSLEQDVETRQADFRRRLSTLGVLIEAVVDFDRPIVASIRGAVAGAGLLYPLVADYVVGDDTAAFVFAHQRVGLSPDGGVTALLPQVVGLRMARTLMLTGAKVDATEALRLGLLTRLVPAETLEDEAHTQAVRFARAPQRALSLAKTLTNAAQTRSFAEQLDAESAGIVACVGNDDFVEGVRAFVEKRTPSFPSGRSTI